MNGNVFELYSMLKPFLGTFRGNWMSKIVKRLFRSTAWQEGRNRLSEKWKYAPKYALTRSEREPNIWSTSEEEEETDKQAFSPKVNLVSLFFLGPLKPFAGRKVNEAKSKRDHKSDWEATYKKHILLWNNWKDEVLNEFLIYDVPFYTK